MRDDQPLLLTSASPISPPLRANSPGTHSLLSRLVSPTAFALLIVLLGAVLRLVNLGNRSLWLDEILTIIRSRGPSLSDLSEVMRVNPDQMPLYELCRWLLRGFGEGEYIVRLPAALAGIACVGVIYLLGRTLFNPRVGMYAALLMAIMPAAVWYAQEARPYAFLMLFAAGQMLMAYRAVTHGHLLDWLGLVLFCLLSLYSHHLGLAITGAVLAFVGLTLVFRLAQEWRLRAAMGSRRNHLHQPGGQTTWALLAAVLVALGYRPGFLVLQGFLSRRDLVSREATPATLPTWGEVERLLAQFDLSGLMLTLLVVGVLAGLRWLFRSQGLGVFLVGISLGGPLIGFWWLNGGNLLSIPPRYLSFLFPGALLIVALGADTMASGLAWLAQRLGRYVMPSSRAPVYVPRVAMVVMALALLAWTYPRLVASYRQPKEDYRGAAQHILATSLPTSTVIALGKGQSFVVTSLGFYLNHLISPIPVTPGLLMDQQTVTRLQEPSGEVWGAVFTSIEEDKPRIIPPTFEVTPLTGLLLVRVPQAGSKAEQAEALLRWGSTFQPALESSADFVALKGGKVKLGANLLPDLKAPARAVGSPTEYWNLTPGTRLADDKRSFVLTPTGEMVNVTFSTQSILPGERYALFFSCRNGDLKGDQRVYVTPTGSDGKWIDIIPSGAGYLCPPSEALTSQAFSFQVPSGTKSLGLWLRATGSGTAEYADLELRRLE